MLDKEYIERNSLIENLRKFAPEQYTDLINQLILKQPTEDVQPVVHAKWEKPIKPYPYYSWKCSECGCEEYRQTDRNGQYLEMKYCPNCGAKMDKKEATYIKDIFMTR